MFNLCLLSLLKFLEEFVTKVDFKSGFGNFNGIFLTNIGIARFTNINQMSMSHYLGATSFNGSKGITIEPFNRLKVTQSHLKSSFYMKHEELIHLGIDNIYYLVMKESMFRDLKLNGQAFTPNGYMTSLILKNAHNVSIKANVSVRLFFSQTKVNINAMIYRPVLYSN